MKLSNEFRGWLGEQFVIFGLWLFLDRNVYQRFHDVIVPTANGTTQIDHLVISPFGLFVIETKNMRGWIYGNEDQAQWTQAIGGRKSKFQNPLRQNYRHTKALEEYLGLAADALHSVVFFVGGSRFKTRMPENVMDRGIVSYIKSHKKMIMSIDEMYQIRDKIQRLVDEPLLNHRTHIRSINRRYARATTCPKCGAALVERTAKQGPRTGQKFLGCATYPRCRYQKRDQ